MISYILYDIITDITYDIQVQGRKTYAGMTNSAAYEHFTGKECLDVHLLKQARLDVLPGQPDVVCVQMMGSRRGQRGLSIRIANPI